MGHPVYKNQKFECQQVETNKMLKIEAFVIVEWLNKHFAFFVVLTVNFAFFLVDISECMANKEYFA